LGLDDLGFDYWNLTLDEASETTREFFEKRQQSLSADLAESRRHLESESSRTQSTSGLLVFARQRVFPEH
jgi:isopropylmalate/homocitrate/citramalate synthase